MRTPKRWAVENGHGGGEPTALSRIDAALQARQAAPTARLRCEEVSHFLLAVVYRRFFALLVAIF